MYFLYIDESGDPGSLDPAKPPHLQPSRHYILTGVAVPAKDWRQYLALWIEFRRSLRKTYGLLSGTELHGAELINSRGNVAYSVLRGRKTRVAVYRDALRFMAEHLTSICIFNVHLDKQNPKSLGASQSDIQDLAWNRLLTRFNTFLLKSCGNQYGLVFADQTNEQKIRRMLRSMRIRNAVPSHFGGTYNAALDQIVEDPVMRNSHQSVFVQMADLVAHALYRKLYRKAGYAKFNVDRLFDEVDARLVKEASKGDPQGIIHL